MERINDLARILYRIERLERILQQFMDSQSAIELDTEVINTTKYAHTGEMRVEEIRQQLELEREMEQKR